MRVTEIVQYLLPVRAQFLLELAINVLIAAVLCSLIYYGYAISFHTWAQKTTVLYWPVGVLYASMPTGMLFTLIFHIQNTLIDLRRGPNRVEQTPEAAL